MQEWAASSIAGEPFDKIAVRMPAVFNFLRTFGTSGNGSSVRKSDINWSRSSDLPMIVSSAKSSASPVTSKKSACRSPGPSSHDDISNCVAGVVAELPIRGSGFDSYHADYVSITAGICDRRNGVRCLCMAAMVNRSCPLRVKANSAECIRSVPQTGNCAARFSSAASAA